MGNKLEMRFKLNQVLLTFTLVWTFAAAAQACSLGQSRTSSTANALPTPETATTLAWSTPESRSHDTPAALSAGQQSATGWRFADIIERPLAELSPDAADYLRAREGLFGVGVFVPSKGVLYTENGDSFFHMASVAKVAIMLTLMDKAIQEGRDLTGYERSMLDLMITLSDNDAATEIWHEAGGSTAIADYLECIGVWDIQPDPEGYWGDSSATPKGVALLLAKLVWGEILDEPTRALAMSLMEQVALDQSWGIAATVTGDRQPGTVVGIKDGWYPEDAGWWVNSAGFILPGNEQPAYTIAVLTGEQDTLEYGIETIEGVANLLDQALR